MINFLKQLFLKYKEVITYIIFGILTTAVNFVIFKLGNILLGEDLYLVSNIIAWIISVVFAYITNKLWVFESKSWAAGILGKEISSFFGARVFSLLFEEAGLFLFVDLLHFDKHSISTFGIAIGGKMIAKVILAVIVVILNYFFSKLVIFKKKDK